MIRTRIIIFAKAPMAGFAKTRLIPALGAADAGALAQQMLLHTLQQAIDADIGTVELCVTPSLSDEAWRDVPLPSGIEISDQGAGDLGERLAGAAKRALERGVGVLLIGTDCVEMSAELLRNAAGALSAHDSVIHCTLDGGYALLGLKRFSEFLFGNIYWSTNAVASTTISRIGQLGWSVHVGEMLHDVDEPDDLRYLAARGSSYVAA